MSLLGSAVLVNWGGIVQEKESDYNQWHSLEHMPERISLPGFLRGCRAQGEPGTEVKNKYFMMYEAEKKEIFISKKYLERLNNPTTWTKDILSSYISPSRTICSVIASKSVGLSGFLSTIRFLDHDIENKFNVEKLKLSIPRLIKSDGITGMHVLLGDNTFGQMRTEEKKYRASQGMDDQVISQAIIIEGLNYSALRKAVESFVVEHSINVNIITNFYCCQHILTKQDLIGV